MTKFISKRNVLLSKRAQGEDPAKRTADSLFKIIQFSFYRVPPHERDRFYSRIRGKIMKLDPSQLGTKAPQAKDAIGQAMGFTNKLLSGLNPVFIQKVLAELTRLLTNPTTADLEIFKRAKSSYVEKRKEESGNITYLYSKKHIEKRNKKKMERLKKLNKSLSKLRSQVRKDLKNENEYTKYTALAVALIDETYERVGNPQSAKDLNHYGVTTWKKKHVSFGKGKAKIKYVGKSGVKQEKEVTEKSVISTLKDLLKGKKDNDTIFKGEGYSISADVVNKYLAPFNVSAKDIRGLHANEEMRAALKKVRKGKLPSDAKDKEKKLKEEFKEALEMAAARVGHEPGTLKNQYLIPTIEPDYLKDGRIGTLASLEHTIVKTADLEVDENDSPPRIGISPNFMENGRYRPGRFEASGLTHPYEWTHEDGTPSAELFLSKREFESSVGYAFRKKDITVNSSIDAGLISLRSDKSLTFANNPNYAEDNFVDRNTYISRRAQRVKLYHYAPKKNTIEKEGLKSPYSLVEKDGDDTVDLYRDRAANYFDKSAKDVNEKDVLMYLEHERGSGGSRMVSALAEPIAGDVSTDLKKFHDSSELYEIDLTAALRDGKIDKVLIVEIDDAGNSLPIDPRSINEWAEKIPSMDVDWKSNKEFLFEGRPHFMISVSNGTLDPKYLKKVQAEKTAARKTPCQTPGAEFHTKISPKNISVRVTLPESKKIEEEQARLVEDELHNVVELVVSKHYFNKEAALSKRALEPVPITPEVVIEPMEPNVQKAVNKIKSMDPSMFHNVTKIVVHPGGGHGQLGHVEMGPDKDPREVHIFKDRVNQIVQQQFQGQQNPQALQEATERALIEVITHEVGHIGKSRTQEQILQQPFHGEPEAERQSEEFMKRLTSLNYKLSRRAENEFSEKLKKWQKENGLDPTGEIDVETVIALKKKNRPEAPYLAITPTPSDKPFETTLEGYEPWHGEIGSNPMGILSVPVGQPGGGR